MDIDFMYYAFTTVLNKSESEFWDATPKKIYKQLDIHNKTHGRSRNKNSNNTNNNNNNNSANKDNGTRVYTETHTYMAIKD